MNEDNRKKVYDVLKSQTGYRDSYEDFNKAFDANEDNRKRVYDVLKSQTGYLDSYEDFSRGMGYPSSNQPGSVSQQVVNEYEQSSMNTDAVLNDNPVGPQRQPAQSPEEDKRTIFANYVQEQLGNIDRELAKPREALPMPAGSAFIPSTAVAAAQRYGNAQTREQQDRYTSLQAARNFLDEANKVVTEAGKKGKTNFVAGALRGIRDKGFDPDTWMMGISETSYYNLLRRAAEKEERGETLSAEEQQLLDAAAVNMAANAYYASDLGRGYKAGAVTAESIPFMLQFAVNPLSGAGTGIAKTILKHGIKRFGLNTAKRTLAGRAVRGAARVAGDAVAAAGVTATTGLGNVAEDAERRMAGDVQFSQDNNGNIQYAGRVNNVEDTGEAIARAFASTFFENQSEMVGNYFAPIMRGVSRFVTKYVPGVKQLSASKVGEIYRGIKDNPTYKEFTDRTQWHGAIGEYAEEVYNNLASVAMGDMTPEELVDLDNNIDTFLGVGLMSAVFGGIGAAGFARDRYTLNRDIRRFEADLTPEEMERWQAVKQVATSGDVEGVREFVKYTMRDDSLTPQEKKDKIAYIYNVMKQSAMEGVAAEQTEEAVEAETQDILAHSDQAANTYTECNRIVVNDVGEMVEQPGHIVGYMGGQPLWIPDGAEPGAEAIPLKEGEYNPESIQSMPTQEVIDETVQAIREDAAEQARRESTYSPDIVPPSIGTTFADGASQYQIVQQNPEGGWLATLTTVDDKGKTVQEIVPVTEQEYYDLMQEQIDAQEAGAGKEQQPAAPATYSINQEKINSATVSDYKKANPRINESYYEENPENIKRDLLERARYAADYLSGRISDRDYLLSLNYVDTYLDRIGKDQIRAMADEESRNYMPYLNREEDTQQPAPANPVQSDAQRGSKTMPPSLQGESNAPVQTEQQPSSEIPTDEKGNLLYHRAPVERTVSSINSEGLEPEEVDAFIQANKDAAAKQLKSIEGKAPKMGTNIAKYKADKAAWQARVADAQAQVDYWNQVGETISAQRIQVGDTTAEDIRAMGEPMNGHELAAMMLATGRLPLLQSDFKRETGYKGDEARSLFGLFASEANGGMTIERAGEQLMLADLEGGTHFFDQDDPNAGRNAILNVLSEVRTRGDLTNYIRRNREALAERERQAEYDAYADWCDEVMHMTPEEYEAYQEYIAENNPYEGVAVEELDRIFAEAEEEIQNNLINTSEYGQEGTSENGSETDSGPSERDEPAGEAGGREASVPVLPGAQPVLQGQEPGRAGGTEAASRPADDGVRAAEGAVAEGASGGEEGVGVQAGTAKEVRAIVPERQESESLLDYAERVAKVKEIADARKEVSANPTDAQKEAGNYKKGHITLDGYDITIENPKGSARYGVDVNGKPWAVQMENDYGYIRGTEGVDGDHIDVFLSDDPTTGKVYVIDQVKEDGSFDEHKVMYGFKSALAAKRAYLSNYSPGWQGLGTISEVSKEEFRKWVDSSHRKTKPFAEYKNVKVEGAQSESRNSKSSKNRLITDERYAELKKRMKQKLRGQMNMGIDPEILAIGTEMAVYHIEKGARKFAEYAKAMIADLGDAIRPYLKSFYNGARDLPEVQEAGLTDDMDSYDEVSRFDVANFDKDVPNVLDMAETIAKEQEVQAQAGVAKEKIARKRASKKKVKDKSVPLSLNDLFTQAEEQSNEQRSTEPDSSLGGRARQETERTEQRGDDRSLHGDNVPDADGSRRVPEPAGTSRRQPVVRNQRNYRFGEEGIRVPQGDIAKLKANVEAIRTLKEIEASGQPATEEQKETLSRYVGWGGLADALNEDKYNARNSYYKDANWNSKYLPYYEQLRELLSEEEFRSAVQSTTTSHYTPTPVIRALWNIVERSGFKGGIVSEPAMGIGHIIGLMPTGLSAQSRIGGYEIDSLSGRIATQLYPDADVKVEGYETNFAPQSKDLVITNVPFGRDAPYDKNLDRSLKRELGNAYNLHNYFIAKGLLELKEGGLGVFVTSSATMDGSDSSLREFVAANNIDLVGAIRLPNNAFLQNAGTSVTADILVFRKRKTGEPSNGIGFVSTTQIGEGTYEENGETRTKPILVNEYFAEHPDMMLGEMMTAFDAGSGGLYSGASQTLKPKDGADLAKELEKVIAQLPENILSQGSSVTQMQEREATTLRNGTITTKDGKVYVAVNGELASVEAKETFTFNGKERKTADAVDDYNALKDTLKKLIAAEQSEEADPKSLRKQLNVQYDAFVSKYGTLNRNKALDDVFAEDYEHNLPLSLEEVSRVPSATGKSMVWQVKKGKGILDRRVSYPVNEPVTADNLQDAVNISLSYKGTLDIPYMARLMDETEEQVTDEILEQGAAYRDPITGALVDRDTYLSGNVREKLEEARAAAESNPDYQKNVEDLMVVQPETIRFGDISYRLGTPWIPTEYINDFAENVLGISGADVQFEPLLNEFVVSRRAHITDFAKSGLYKTERMGAIDLFVNSLNQRKPKVYDEQTTYGPTGKSTTRVPNEAETQAASEKIMEISDKFIEYIDGRNGIHRELERIYNDRYNNYRLKKYSLPFFSHKEKGKDGKEVLVTHYPGSNESISLREHQAKAVQRSLHESTLLAHQVGTGKTFTMITTAMEMRRLGLARKPMIVVQNATLEDFVKDFYRLYPSANVLAPSKDERSAENRKRLFNLIATGDFDAIVIPQSFLAFIPDDEGRKKELVQKRIDEYQEAIAKTDDYALQRRLQKEMEGLRDSLEGGKGKKSKKNSVKEKAKAADRAKSRVERVLDRKTDDVMSFEKLGIDALFIDEAHNFKKIGFATKMNNVKGVDSGASQRANSLLLKARWVQEKNGGRNVILATGTPITNTMAEVWTMMNFVSPDILEAYNIRSFDYFATTFGTVEPSLEFTATGNFKIADRFKSYVNVPELLKAFRSHADVVLTEDVKEFRQDKNIPKLADGKMENIVIDKNEDLQDVMDMLVRELEEYNKLTGQAKREKSALPLVVFTKAKQAAIDLRLLNPSYADNPNSKTNQVVRNIVKLYKESTPDKGTQLVFCDSYQSPGERPKMDLFDYDPDVSRFNLYEDMKEKLVAAGIPANEIAIVNNYDGDRRKALFEKVRNGDVRILLGSTEKMGVGVNVQDRLFALHHVDAPLRPMDFEQRNGRILRQGNLYATWDKPVHVLTYGVQGTLDATAYDRLRVKQEFINQMMKGNTDSRVMEEQDDEDPSGMTFSQMAATLSGDKTAQLLFAAQNKLKRLRNSKRSDANSKSAMADTIESAKNRIKLLQASRAAYEKADKVVDEHFPHGVKKIKVNGQNFTEKFGTSLDPVIDAYDDSYSLNRGIAPLKLSLNDGAAEVVVHYNEGRMVYELYAGKEHIVEGRQFNGGRGLMSSIDHQLDAIHKNLSDTEANIQAQEKKIEGLTQAMNTPWGREEELKEAEKEVADLQKQLEDKAKDNEKERKERYRDGSGNVSDADLASANDPVSKFLGQSTRTAKQRRAFSERERRNMAARIQELAGKLHLNNVEIVTDVSTLQGRRAKAKGFFNPTTGKITIVIPNHAGTFDAEQTLLHEAVAHYGLRRLFGEHFDTFLDNVFNNADVEVRRKIVALAQKNDWDTRLATEEYLASLAEGTNFDDLNASWWRKIKELFLRMLHKIGFEGFDGVTLSDNELRYILWRSYENLREPGRYRSILGQAEDIAKQYELKVGNYAPTDASVGQVAEGNLLFRETPDGNTADDGTREAYNRAVSGNRFKAQEAYQDNMLALKRLQEVIEQRTGKLKSYENAYLAENQMSSKSTRETEVYGEKFFKPMLETVGKLIEQGASYGEIIDYMVAKHGLERNDVFAERDARQEADRRFEKLYKEIEQLYKLGGIAEKEYDQRKGKIDAEKEKYYRERLAQHLDEDYSGLTALRDRRKVVENYPEGSPQLSGGKSSTTLDEPTPKDFARQLVEDFESRHDTRDLWDKVDSATKETLRKSYESGMMSRDTYNKVKGQFKHYIPLRGWDEQTAEDVYEYLNSETSPVNSVLKAAKGRRSMADDPLATIGNMAESAILQGNRNLMKQAFLNMAINHPTDVLTLKEAWYVQDPSTGEWTLSFPDIQEVDDADTVSAKVEEHEQRMRELKADGLATQVKEGLNINYRIGTRQAQEHIVTVKRNGRDYLVYVNGNPRAAQAVNGLTNPTVESNKLLAGIARFNRELAANFTNRNPAFVLSNLSRDLIFSVSAVAIKENPRYAAKFAKNIPRAMRVIFRNLRGKGSETNADDRLFEEFLANGGETGYTSLHSVDDYKKLVRRSVDKYAGKRDYFAAVRSAAGFFSMMNRWAEDVSRFTTYMTSKEEGRTVTEAVNDAKEVTVNFNRRGAATKTEGVFGWTSGLFRNLYLFFNAAVQSLTNFARLAKKNRKGFLTALGGFTAAGFLVPWLNTLAISMLGGDDDDYYGNLPDWVRRNNLCLYAGNGKFITIPLPIELRAFYGLGEMAYQATVRQDYDKAQIAYQAVNQITELLPINPLGNNGDLVTTMMPDVLSPFWQIYENKDFTGKPIYRENAFNKTMPEWTKAYNSTSDWLVDLSRWTNELAGGDDYKQAGVLESLMNWNPAKVEHLFESYFGGMAKTFNQTVKTLIGGVKSAMEGEWSDDLQLYSTPVLNRFINDASDDRSAYSKLNQRYYKLYDLYDEVQKLNRGYANEVARGNMDYLDKLVRLQQSRDFKVYQLFRRSKRAIDRIRDIEKHLPEEGSEQRRKELQEETNRLKRQLLERVDELE